MIKVTTPGVVEATVQTLMVKIIFGSHYSEIFDD